MQAAIEVFPMHIVTKILVVFGAILSVLLAALTIAFAANADAVRGAMQNEQTAKLTAIAERDRLQQDQALMNQSLVQARNTAEAAVASMKAQLDNLQSERTGLMGTLQEARLQKQSNEDTATSLSATVKANQALIEALTKEISELRNERMTSARREAELVDRLNDLESNRQVLEQSTRALQEQLAEAKLTMERIKSGGTASASTDQPFNYSGPVIQGRILNVSKNPAGGQMAEISVGSGSGLKPNMRLSIVRDGRFIANFIVTTVDVQRAVGTIDTLKRDVQIASGDTVLSRLD
jgi:hypothetical protein